MNDKPFSNREITAMFETIKSLLDSHTEVHGEIVKLQEYTNGKVAELVKWRERVNGGATVAGVFMSVIVIPVLGWSIWSLIHLPQLIEDAVEKALVIYEIP